MEKEDVFYKVAGSRREYELTYWTNVIKVHTEANKRAVSETNSDEDQYKMAGKALHWGGILLLANNNFSIALLQLLPICGSLLYKYYRKI